MQHSESPVESVAGWAFNKSCMWILGPPHTPHWMKAISTLKMINYPLEHMVLFTELWSGPGRMCVPGCSRVVSHPDTLFILSEDLPASRRLICEPLHKALQQYELSVIIRMLANINKSSDIHGLRTGTQCLNTIRIFNSASPLSTLHAGTQLLEPESWTITCGTEMKVWNPQQTELTKCCHSLSNRNNNNDRKNTLK